LVGKLLKHQGKDEHADQWEVVEFPAIMPESDEPLWPEFWKKEELLSVKASLPISKWKCPVDAATHRAEWCHRQARMVAAVGR
jgi:hypothetical protein